ncbi:hypothetical protein PG989_012185 [Apiospora arundinis]
MSNKTVKWSDSSVSGHKGSSRYDHDSGVGSLSSEQASTGGKPDRRFTAEDLERQRRSPRVLQEALRAKDDELAQVKKDNLHLVSDNKRLYSEQKATERDYKTLADERSNLQARVTALQIRNEELQSDNERLKTDNYNLHRKMGTSVTSESDYTAMMSGGLGESSTGLPHRTKSKSKHEVPDMDRMKNRIKPPKEEPPKRSSSKRRGSSSAPGARKPYIEEKMTTTDVSRPPPAPSASYHHAPVHYSYTPAAPLSYSQSNMPRTVSSVGSTYTEESGDYVAYPLPTERHHRKSKH